uniref:Uncharacterized protein n=1 Tax=Oncorhynchus kisutch TaxID=8019 RepID=A0A8C7G448_ONCKI
KRLPVRRWTQAVFPSVKSSLSLCTADRTWGYLESEEHYGTSPVWSNYRRNQKGGIPPQKTRNTCIVDTIIHYQVWSLTFTHGIYTYTIIMRDVKLDAMDHWLLPFQVPHVDFSGEDYSNSHDAVGSAPLPPTMTPWYRWYHTIQPDETEVAQVKKTNEAHLTEESW